ncbi:hypothetical protein BGZ72_010526 [Mortierella alpina]|nr:hypothetical protein BGZ72_010526 [Mortierella alpina]
MALDDPSELKVPPITEIPSAPLLAPRSLFSFRPSALLTTTQDNGGDINGTDDRARLRARIRKRQAILRDRLSELTPAGRSAVLTISTTAPTFPASVALQSMSHTSMPETSPNESQMSIGTTASTGSPSSDSSISALDKSACPAFEFCTGFSLEDEKSKKSCESEHESEQHENNNDEEADHSGGFSASEDSVSEVSQSCSEPSRGSMEGKPKGVRQALRAVSASVKKKLHKLWPEDDDEHAQLRWIHLPADEHDDDNPFYQVRYGVKFQNLVPQPPARFPYAPQLSYASRYGSAVTVDPKENANLKEDERLRERQNRRALLRRRSTTGRFRRRPNIILPPTEGRITEPVEVARIRRAYGGASASKTRQAGEDRDMDSLLETINRQVRTGTREWTLTGTERRQQQPVLSATSILPGDVTRIAILDANQKIVSRRSLNRTVSTRAQGRPVRKEDLYRSKSSFSAHWQAYQHRKLTSKRDSKALELGSRDLVVESDPAFAQDLAARLEQVAATDQRAETCTRVQVQVQIKRRHHMTVVAA